MDQDRVVDIVIISIFITIIVLKIVNVITIPWVWLLSPLWIIGGLAILCLMIFTVMALIYNYKRRK